MKRGFFGQDLLYQAGNPVLRELVGDIGRYPLVMFDLVVEFGASLAHGSPCIRAGAQHSRSPVEAKDGTAMDGNAVD
jgi:hypothetical protein